MDKGFYNMINADVIRNKEIQKVTGVSPAQEAWKAMNDLPYRKKPTWKERLKLWWYDITYRRECEQAYKDGFAAGREFEFKTAQLNEAGMKELRATMEKYEPRNQSKNSDDQGQIGSGD